LTSGDATAPAFNIAGAVFAEVATEFPSELPQPAGPAKVNADKMAIAFALKGHSVIFIRASLEIQHESSSN
jgi:hypothetical protein